ncbi:MAG: hypothetical protein RLZZ373_2649 [Pseudomonadota bacterium]|jgi:hypothetical protein
MPQLILHKDGAYNLYTTVADGPCYDAALTLDDLKEVLRMDGGQRAIDGLPARLERAHKTGCSSIDGMTLLECIAGNRAGPGESEVPADEFIIRWLTLPAPDAAEAQGEFASA